MQKALSRHKAEINGIEMMGGMKSHSKFNFSKNINTRR